MTVTLQDSAASGPDREHVARARQVAGPGTGVSHRPDRAGALRRWNAGRGALPEVDRHGERRAVQAGVRRYHLRQVKLIAPAEGKCGAHDPGGVPEQVRHGLVIDALGGDHQVALVLARLVVEDDDELPAREAGDRPLNLVPMPGHDVLPCGDC